MSAVDLVKDTHTFYIFESGNNVRHFVKDYAIQHMWTVKVKLLCWYRPPPDGGENWSELRKQLREFTLNTQQELEQERAQLLTKNAVLEEECKELHSYINSHLAR